MGSAKPPGRLRGELTDFVGRRAELAQVRQVLGTARLVTLTGPGGIGKTRLALQAAANARRAFADGAWLAELGGLRDPALLVPEVARSLGLSDKSVRWAVAALSDYLQPRQMLLVLDQCEHLADGCAVMADALLRSCPGLRILATSRHVLGVAGEVTIPVPPMTIPAADPAGPDELLRFEAGRLFTGRAAAVHPGFALDAGNTAAVATICRRLDGIPLAIELAAVRLRSLSPGQILSRLDSRFPLLSGGGPAGQPHHRALQATLEWSYSLLTDAERAMWRRVSVFAGSFDLDAAEAVCAGEGISAGQIADLIDGLVAKSILLRGDGPGTARYRLLDTIGEFGLCKLRAEGKEREFRVRHRDWYASLAAQREAFGRRRVRWLDRLDMDHGNLRGALGFALSQPRGVSAGAEMACDLWRYWETHGHLTEGRRVLATAVEELEDSALERPRALWVAGFLAQFQGDIPTARALLEAALSAARTAGDMQAEAWASSFLGWDLYFFGDVGQGHALAQTALRLHREAGDQIGVVLALMQIGYIHLCAGAARPAADSFSECARVCESTGNAWYQAYSRWGLGVAALLSADYGRAASLECEALHAMRHMADPMGVALCVDALAWVAAARKEEASRAVALLAAAEAAWAAIPATPAAPLRRHHEAALAAARKALPGDQYRAATAKGAVMSQAEAIGYALGESRMPPSRPAVHPGEDQPPLTRREQDVAMLVARGMSNNQIAATLVISARTVETHVQHIMGKLGFTTRAQIAAWAAARPGGGAEIRTGIRHSPDAGRPVRHPFSEAGARRS